MKEKFEHVEYEKLTLSETDIVKNPFDQLDRWWNEAIRADIYLWDAIHLSTVDQNHHPDARIVLLRAFDQRGLIFYSNYDSEKGQQLAHHPHACAVIFWPELERQIRIKGRVEKTTREQSQDYFKTRSKGSQLGAWASPQSSILRDRDQLESLFRNAEQRFKANDIPCPPNWGGYRLIPSYFEFWQGRLNRLHDRFCYQRKDEGHWFIARLAP